MIPRDMKGKWWLNWVPILKLELLNWVALRPQDTMSFDCASAPATHGLGAYSPNKTGASVSPICFNMLNILERFKRALFVIEFTLSLRHRQGSILICNIIASDQK